MNDMLNRAKGKNGGLGGKKMLPVIQPGPVEDVPVIKEQKSYTVYIPYAYEKKDGTTGVEAATLTIKGEKTIRRMSQVSDVIVAIMAGNTEYTNVVPINFIPMED